MTLSDNEYVKISLDTKTPCLEWIGKKYMPSAEFRASEERSLKFYQQYKASYPNLQWYVDARKIGAISPFDTKWVANVLLNKFAEAGLSKEAFVIPQSAIGKMVLRNYISTTGKKIEISIFDSVVDAKNWLKQ